MSSRHLSFTKYIGTGFAFSIAFASFFGAGVDARAQDLNLQTQINITSPPPFTTTPPSTDIVSDNYVTWLSDVTWLSGAKKGSCSPVSSLEVLQFAARSMSPKKFAEESVSGRPMSEENKIEFLRKNPQELNKILKGLVAQGDNSKFKPFELKQSPIKFGCDAQPTTVKVSFPFNPTNETNILKKGNNGSPGESFGFGGNVLATTAGLRPLDLVALSAGEASARYIPNVSPNLDTVTGYLAYQYFLNARGIENGQWVPVDENNKNPPPANMITVNTVAFGLLNQTSYAPTFHTEKADFLTPQFTLSSQNIDLDDPSHLDCASFKAFCHYANLSLTVGQSFSDVLSQQNFNVAGSATLGWRMTSELTLALQAMATAKDYEDFVGGRRDLLLQVGPALTYVPTNNLFTFMLPVSYYKNYSTVSAAAWSGLVVTPTLTIAFTYPPN